MHKCLAVVGDLYVGGGRDYLHINGVAFVQSVVVNCHKVHANYIASGKAIRYGYNVLKFSTACIIDSENS